MFPNKHCILREKAEPVWEFCNLMMRGAMTFVMRWLGLYLNVVTETGDNLSMANVKCQVSDYLSQVWS